MQVFKPENQQKASSSHCRATLSAEKENVAEVISGL